MTPDPYEEIDLERLYRRLTGTACTVWSNRLATLVQFLDAELLVTAQQDRETNQVHRLAKLVCASQFHDARDTWREVCEALEHDPDELGRGLPGGAALAKYDLLIERPRLPSGELLRMMSEAAERVPVADEV